MRSYVVQHGRLIPRSEATWALPDGRYRVTGFSPEDPNRRAGKAPELIGRVFELREIEEARLEAGHYAALARDDEGTPYYFGAVMIEAS